MKEDKPLNSKVYYGFTPHIDPKSAEHEYFHVPCARGAVAMIKQDDKIHYGFTICSENDNFSRSFGRKQAHARLAMGLVSSDVVGYNYFHIPPLLQKKFEGDDHELCLYMLNSIVDGLTAKISKAQRKLGETRKEYEKKQQRLLGETKEKSWEPSPSTNKE